jgi:hypothetical protein
MFVLNFRYVSTGSMSPTEFLVVHSIPACSSQLQLTGLYVFIDKDIILNMFLTLESSLIYLCNVSAFI